MWLQNKERPFGTLQLPYSSQWEFLQENIFGCMKFEGNLHQFETNNVGDNFPSNVHKTNIPFTTYWFVN